MAILLDSGILYALYDRRDAWHRAATELIRREQGGLVVPTPVIPEVDHLLGKRLGIGAQILFYQALLAMAEILGLGRIATTDRRDFELVRTSIPIELLPA